MTEPLLRAENLHKLFPVGEGMFRATTDFIHAVDGISFDVYPGETLGLVGESGCGKTTTGRLLVRLIKPTRGHILLRDDNGGYQDIAAIPNRSLWQFRRRVQMIFQDPYESLNPRRTIYDTIAEPLAVRGLGNIVQREQRVMEMLNLVGLSPPASFMFRYPHELSGGQRQRVAIARALIVEPDFVVADEPTSMLDMSTRVDIMRLMLELGEHFGVSYLYITHDLAVARYMCHRIAVMYLGKIIEVGATKDVLHSPQHPYTRALVSAVPSPDPRAKRQPPDIKGSVSKPINPHPCCRFYERCPRAKDICRESQHPPLEVKAPHHYAACYLVE